MNDLDEGRFIQNSIETVFLDMDGKQLLCESLFLYGVMLLNLDIHIEGPIREKLLVAYFRYSGQQNSSESKFEDIVQLLRSTGYSPNQIKRIPKYPESFFKRALIPEHFVRMVVGRLRSDDIYCRDDKSSLSWFLIMWTLAWTHGPAFITQTKTDK